MSYKYIYLALIMFFVGYGASTVIRDTTEIINAKIELQETINNLDHQRIRNETYKNLIIEINKRQIEINKAIKKIEVE